MPFLKVRSFAAPLAILAGAAPATAHEHPYPAAAAAYAPASHAAAPGYDRAGWDQARADWLYECRANRSHGRKAGKIGGTVVGGVLGGIVGSAVAAPGDKTLGTIAGAAVGAVAGGALGASADRAAERRSLDWCESYLDRYMASSGYGQTYAYQPMMVMVPVGAAPMAAPRPQPRECTETQVIEEVAPAPRARRIIPRARPVPARREPDKRIPIG